MENVIQIKNLHKSFGDVKAVNDLSFKVKRGELFAFLGVNGAGKSTTISILCGQLKKDSGYVEICGENAEISPNSVSKRLGVVFQSSVLDAPLSVRDNLESRAALYGIKGNNFTRKLDELAKMLDFSDILSRPVGKLSGGQRRRIDIARALLHDPEILVLDEPTTGLDPQTRQLMWSVISKLRRERGMTVFLTTHYMEETADADYVVILDSGKLAAEGTPLELKNRYTGDFVTFYGVTERQIAELGLDHQVIRDAIRVSIPNTAYAVELIKANPDIFADFEIKKGKMDDVFLAVTGKKIERGEDK